MELPSARQISPLGEERRKVSKVLPREEGGGKFGVGGNKCDDVRSGNSIRGADCGLSSFSRPASSFPLNVVIVARLYDRPALLQVASVAKFMCVR